MLDRSGRERVITHDLIAAEDDVRSSRAILLILPGMLLKEIVERCRTTVDPETS